MKNWKIVLWLVLFFPVGYYLLLRYSDWRKPIKFGILGVFLLALFLGGNELWANYFFISSIFAIIVGLFTLFRKKSKQLGLTTLALGILVFSVSGVELHEYQKQEQLAIEAEAEAEAVRVAEEERLAEIARLEEQERLEEKQLRKEVISYIEEVEEFPTQKNYDKALELLEKLETEDLTLANRLEGVLPEVEAYEELVATAKEAVDHAITVKNRETYEEAYEMVAALPIPNRSLTLRLETLDEDIKQAEEEERLAAEKAAEEERIAAEEKERQVAQKQAQSNSNTSDSESAGSSSGNAAQTTAAAVVPPAQTDNVEKVVYIAPQSGTKYHFSAGCRGLNNANSVQEMSLTQAKSQGYDLCGWEK